MFNNTERVGVSSVDLIVQKDFKWIFREQPIADFGIDAQIERVDNNIPTGKLIGLQIKSGASHFKKHSNGLLYYGKSFHLDYWMGHSLPVLLIGHIPESNETYWEVISENNIKRTDKAWKIILPFDQKFDASSLHAISPLFDGNESEQRLRRLSIDEPLMRHIQKGGKVSLELQDWINKTLGRTPVEVYIHDELGNETLSLEWFQYYTGYEVRELAEALFPWAKARVDADFYEIHEEEEDTHEKLMRIIDEEHGIYRAKRNSDTIYPYAVSMNEVEHYRLVLELNELGKSFLVISDYLGVSGNAD